MLTLAQVSKRDVVFDVGAGDGRMLLSAWRLYGARGVGYELDESLAASARESFAKAGVAEDCLKVYCSDALVWPRVAFAPALSFVKR